MKSRGNTPRHALLFTSHLASLCFLCVSEQRGWNASADSTCIHAPVFSLHKQQIRAHLLLGIWDTLVIGSIFSGFPMLTCAMKRVTCWSHVSADSFRNANTSREKSPPCVDTNSCQCFMVFCPQNKNMTFEFTKATVLRLSCHGFWLIKVDSKYSKISLSKPDKLKSYNLRL